METNGKGRAVSEGKMKFLLPTARPLEVVESIPYLPFDTIVISNDPDSKMFGCKYEVMYSSADGYWLALNDFLKDYSWTETFCLLADDIKPQEDWWKAAMAYWRDNVKRLGLVALNDLNVMHGGAAFSITTREWLQVLFGDGGLFPKQIAHNFLDTILADRSKSLGRYFFCKEAVVEHMHPTIGKGEDDSVYQNNRLRAKENKDKKWKDRFDKSWREHEKETAMEHYKELENKTAFFVLGGEGTGTHMMRNALVEAGCHWEQWYEEVDEDKLDFDGVAPKLVIRRSLPHAHKWPDLERIHAMLESVGYNIFVIFTIRDFHASAKSVVRRGYDDDGGLEKCYKNQFDMVIRMGEYLSRAVYSDNFVYVTYEAFTTSEGFRRWVFERLDLPYPADYDVNNRNFKYYSKE